MARRKVPRHAPPSASTATRSPTAKDVVSARDYYNQRYKEVDQNRRSTGLYEESTESHINRMEGLWKQYVDYFLVIYRPSYSPMIRFRYCNLVNIDRIYTLKKSSAGRINNFFHWMCNEYTMRKVSSVTTY